VALCCILDYLWSFSEFPSKGDPAEAFAEVSGSYHVSRYLLSFLGVLYVALSGATSVVMSIPILNKFVQQFLNSLVVLGCVLLALVFGSNIEGRNYFYETSQWTGPHWNRVVYLQSVATLTIIHQARVKVAKPYTKVFEKHICHWRIFCAGLSLLVLAFVLAQISIAFYTLGPKVSVFGSIPESHQSFLEWHTPGDSVKLGDQILVEWGVDVGIKISDIGSKKIIFQSQSPASAFIIGALSGEGTTMTATNENEMGVFHIVDTPGLLSTEQIVETVDASTDRIQFTGFLYYEPVNLLGNSMSRTPFSIEFTVLKAVNDSVRHLHFSVVIGNNVDRTYLILASGKSERIFGVGGSYSYMDLTNAVIPIISREQGIGRGVAPISFVLDLSIAGAGGSATQTTYTAIPHFTTSESRSMYLNSSELSIMDLRDGVSIEINGTSISGGILTASSILDLVTEYSKTVSGIMRPLPAWTSGGAIVGLQGGRDIVQRKLERLIDANVSIAAIWLQDWTGERETSFGLRLNWSWEVNQTMYPKWWEWIQELHVTHNINVLSYINPYLSVDSSVYIAAEQANCLIMKDNMVLHQWSATPEFKFATIDLLKDECQAWYAKLIRTNMIGDTGSNSTFRSGVMGWMADFGESLPCSISSSRAHNEFPVRWAETNRLAIDGDDYSKSNVVFFTRSAGIKTPGYSTLQWMGDQLTSWDQFDGLHSALIGQLALGLSGFTNIHSDVGGYTMIDKYNLKYLRSDELLVRWMEYSCFADSVFRTHEGLLPDASSQIWDENVIHHFAKFANVHKALGSLRLRVTDTQPGAPVMRATWLHFPQQTVTHSLKTQFLLGGEDIIVCPALRAGISQVNCYLPTNSTYFHMFTNQTFSGLAGQYVKCSASLGNPCVLYTDTERELASEIQKMLI